VLATPKTEAICLILLLFNIFSPLDNGGVEGVGGMWIALIESMIPLGVQR
jgi:hypothetical protein